MEHTRLGIDATGNPVSLQLHERLRQIAVLGKTGMGKSTLLRSIVAQDIARHLAPLFDREHQQFNPHVLHNLNLGEAWCRGSLLYPELNPQTYEDAHNTRRQSRRHYGRPRDVVEREVERIFRHKEI
jgi:Helicase HerA, central domain